MTYSETKSLMDAIQEVESWTWAIQNERNKDKPDWNHLKFLEKWLDESKQKIFDIANKQH